MEFYIERLKISETLNKVIFYNIQYFGNNQYGTKKIKQTAGRDQLGTFALNSRNLMTTFFFGEVWSRTEQLNLRDRSLVTITSLISQGITDGSLTFHLQSSQKQRYYAYGNCPEIIATSASMQDGRKHGRHSRLRQEVWNEDISCKVKMKKQRSTPEFFYRRTKHRLCTIFHW